MIIKEFIHAKAHYLLAADIRAQFDFEGNTTIRTVLAEAVLSRKSIGDIRSVLDAIDKQDLGLDDFVHQTPEVKGSDE